MAKRVKAWSNGKIVAVEREDGGFNYYVPVEARIATGPGGSFEEIGSIQAVQSEISKMNLEVVNALTKEIS